MSGKRASTRLTKNDMARVVVQALFGLTKLPASDNCHVKHFARRKTDDLRDLHKKALAAIESHS